MFVAIGWVVVIGSVIGSFLGVGGHLLALFSRSNCCAFSARRSARSS